MNVNIRLAVDITAEDMDGGPDAAAEVIRDRIFQILLRELPHEVGSVDVDYAEVVCADCGEEMDTEDYETYTCGSCEESN